MNKSSEDNVIKLDFRNEIKSIAVEEYVGESFTSSSRRERFESTQRTSENSLDGLYIKKKVNKRRLSNSSPRSKGSK